MVLLSDLIQVHNNALEPEICDFLIALFDQTSDKHERYDNDGKPNFTQFNLTEHRELTPDINQVHNYIIKKIFTYRDKYYEYVDKRVFPEEHALEQFRIKKYNPGGDDRFDTHVDVINYDSARRFLSFMWYLNDVETGGTTISGSGKKESPCFLPNSIISFLLNHVMLIWSIVTFVICCRILKNTLLINGRKLVNLLSVNMLLKNITLLTISLYASVLLLNV